MACGADHTAFITTEGDLHSFGCNSEGQLPSMGGFPKVTDIACGDNHTALITEQGELYIFGNKKIYRVHPVLGISEVLCKGIDPGDKVIKVSCGGTKTIFMTDQYKIYSFDIYENQQVTIPPNIGLLRSLSMMTTFGVLAKIFNIGYTPLILLSGLYYPVKWAFNWIRTPPEICQGERITQFSIGPNIMAYISKGKLYITTESTGQSKLLLSGSPYQDHYISINHKFQSPDLDEYITQMAVGNHRVILATDSGKVYSACEWYDTVVVGKNVQLSTGTHYEYQEMFTGEVIQIATGTNHTMILARE